MKRNIVRQHGYILSELILSVVAVGLFMVGCAAIVAGCHFLMKFW